MRMEDLGPEDFDDVDESDIMEVNEARPVRGDEVSVILSVPLTHDDFVALSAIAHHRDDSIIAAARDAVREYVATHEQQAARRAS
jgi:hypothetical protein